MALLLQLGKGACAGPDEVGLPGGAGEDGRDGAGVFEGVATGGLLGVGGVDPNGLAVVGESEVLPLGGGADLGEFTGEPRGEDLEGAGTDVVRMGRMGVGTVGRAATPAGVTALEAVKAVGTCSGILAEHALVAIIMITQRNDFIRLMHEYYRFYVQKLTHIILLIGRP